MADYSSLDDLFEAVSIIDVMQPYVDGLVSSGNGQWLSLCPFHSEQNPSFSISETKGLYRCFSCGESGNTITFLKHYLGYSSHEAIKKLREMAGLPEEEASDWGYRQTRSATRNAAEEIRTNIEDPITESEIISILQGIAYVGRNAVALAKNDYQVDVFDQVEEIYKSVDNILWNQDPDLLRHINSKVLSQIKDGVLENARRKAEGDKEDQTADTGLSTLLSEGHVRQASPASGESFVEGGFCGGSTRGGGDEAGNAICGQERQDTQASNSGSNLSKDNVFITNVIGCRPLANKFPEDKKVITECSLWVLAEISVVAPLIVVAIGGQAHKWIRHREEMLNGGDIPGITSVCGKWEQIDLELPAVNGSIPAQTLKVWYMPTLHPSFCMKGADPRFENHPVMSLDSKKKIALFDRHIASIQPKLEQAGG